MDEPVIKDKVIEGEFDFTFKNGEYVEKKKSDELCEDIKPEPKESDSEFEKVSTELSEMQNLSEENAEKSFENDQVGDRYDCAY
ncbi:hypothetical protein L5515_009360 [Caenorhabditis briggsae]|uniref:Uncharacterized protein n=1 Tax=Caenorhabditis briggsae TaxID=6238 RepID=A0AAE9F7T3_CAEBR|nr:hypothetical protein L5515_009360 [Caenorhabditis briggsae]